MISFLKANWQSLFFVLLAIGVILASLYGALQTGDNGLRFIFLVISTVVTAVLYEILSFTKWSTNGNISKV